MKNYLTHGGVTSVVGVFDASRSNESKRTRGNQTKTGIINRRNAYGLNRSVEQVFTYLGFPVVHTPEDLAEGDTMLAQLQMLGLVDIIDSNDSDIFACGGSLLLKDANPGAKLGQDGGYLWELSKTVSRAEVACCAVLSGSDTSEGVKGVGLKTAQRALRTHIGGVVTELRFF